MSGWSCPNCGKAHAPHIDTCPEPAQAAPWAYPLWPEHHPDKILGQPMGPWAPPPYTTCGLGAAANDAIFSDIEGLYEQ